MSRLERVAEPALGRFFVPEAAQPFTRLLRPSLIVGGVGVLAGLIGAWSNPDRFWQAYLLAYSFWLALPLGSLGLVMLHHLAGGRWSNHIRRVGETSAATLPLMALLFLPLLFNLGRIYPWADPTAVHESALLQQKSAYLNAPFFAARAVVYFGVWLLLARLLDRWSHAQDGDAGMDFRARLRRLSAAGMILYVLTATFAAYDWLMSLEPEWFSSIYGLLIIAGHGLAGLALAILGLGALARNAPETRDLWRQTFNDLGNLLLGFVMIWAYFGFSQLLVIWSANIPEEALWYVHRSQHGWLAVGVLLALVQFAGPFLLLLLRAVKRSGTALMGLAVVILLARWLDLFWLIMPAFSPDRVALHWLDGALFIGLGGLWTAFFAWSWRGRAPLARGMR